MQVARGRAVFESDTSGLEAGDRVVVSQLLHPRDGMEVAEAADAPAPAATAAALDDGDST